MAARLKITRLGVIAFAVPLALGSMLLATPSRAGVSSTAPALGAEVQVAEASVPKEELKTYKLPPDKEAQAIAYAHSRHELYFLDFLFTTVALALLIQLAVAPRLRDWAERITSRRFLQSVPFPAPFFFLLGLVSLPRSGATPCIPPHYRPSRKCFDSRLSPF